MTVETLVAVQDDELEQIEEVEEMPSLEHGGIGIRLGRYLDIYVDENQLGLVCNSQTTFKFVGNKPNRLPDLSFVSKARLPKRISRNADFAPDLIVEVLSDSDNVLEMQKKVHQYQKSGVRLIWLIYPYSQTVQVYRLATGFKAQVMIKDEDLDGEDVIPGFKLKIARLFELPNIGLTDDYDDTTDA